MNLTLSPQNLADLEQDQRYKSLLRQSVISQSSYWKGNNGTSVTTETDTKNWYQRRNKAEELLKDPSTTINQQYWSSKSLTYLKNEVLVITYPAYAPGTTYNQGDRVTSAGVEYICIQITQGNAPVSSPTYWRVVTAADISTKEIIDKLESTNRFDAIATNTYEDEADSVPF